MNSTPMTLEDLQRTMGAAVMQPLTPDEEMQPRDTTGRWDGRPMAEVAGQFIAPNDRLTAFDRLEIYNRQYWFRLQSTFLDDFPGLRAVIGPVRFEALSNAYLAAHPSRSFTLRNLGSKLHQWLTEQPAYAGSQLSLALDVVQVEWACIVAFDESELAPLTVPEASAIGADSRLGLQPHLQLLALSYPADDLVLDLHQRQRKESSEAGARPEAIESENAEAVKPLRLRKKATWVAVHRADDSLYYKRLTQPEFRTLCALRNGQTLAEALDQAFTGSRGDAQTAAATRIDLVRQWFANWSELGWLTHPNPHSQEKAG